MNNFKLISSTDNNIYKTIIDGKVYDISISKSGELLNITLSDRANFEQASINNNRIEFGCKGVIK